MYVIVWDQKLTSDVGSYIWWTWMHHSDAPEADFMLILSQVSLDGHTKNSATNTELYVKVGVHSLIDDWCQMLSLTVRSVRLGASQLSWTDASLSGTSWRPWCSCCRYTLYNTCPDNISRVPTYLHDCAAWSGRWCYCCCFRMWFQPRCRWSVWSNQMSSGIRRWHTSASGRRRTAWASRWVSQLLLARVLQVSFILTYAFTELHLMYWEGPEMILELQKLLWIWNICPLLEKDFLLTWWSMRSL